MRNAWGMGEMGYPAQRGRTRSWSDWRPIQPLRSPVYGTVADQIADTSVPSYSEHWWCRGKGELWWRTDRRVIGGRL